METKTFKIDVVEAVPNDSVAVPAMSLDAIKYVLLHDTVQVPAGGEYLYIPMEDLTLTEGD